MVDDLVTWLRAQLDQDERMARTAAGDYPNWTTTSDGNVCQVGTGGSGYLAVGPWEGDLFEVGEHIARHDPARVLAEVDAKRRILDLAAPVDDPHDDEQVHSQLAIAHVLRLIALPYADRPGYRQDWRP